MPGFWDNFGQSAQRSMEQSGANFLQQMAQRKKEERDDRMAQQRMTQQIAMQYLQSADPNVVQQGADMLKLGDAATPLIESKQMPYAAQEMYGGKIDPAVPREGLGGGFAPAVDLGIAPGKGSSYDFADRYSENVREGAKPIVAGLEKKAADKERALKYEAVGKLPEYQRAGAYENIGIDLGVDEGGEMPPVNSNTTAKNDAGEVIWTMGPLAGQRVWPGMVTEGQKKAATDLRKEWRTVNADFLDIGRGWSTMANAAKLKTGASDQALVMAFAKILDPGSVVREGEYATTAGNAQSWFQAIYARLVGKNFEPGAPFLNDQSRQRILDTGQALYQTALGRYNNELSFYQQTATEMGLDPKKVLRSYAEDAPGATTPAGPGGSGGAGGAGSKPEPTWFKNMSEADKAAYLESIKTGK